MLKTPAHQFRIAGIIFFGGLVLVQTSAFQTPLIFLIGITIFLCYIWRNMFCILLLCGLLGGFMSSLKHSAVAKNNLEFFAGQEILFSGFIESFPEEKEKETLFVVNGHFDTTHTRILIKDQSKRSFQYGDRIEAKGTLQIPQPFSDFDYQKYLEKSDIYAILKPKTLKKINTGDGNPFLRAGSRARTQLRKNIENHLPVPHGNIAMGILFGVKKELPKETQNLFNNAGLTHILVVSGFNVSIILLIIGKYLFRFGRRIVFIGTIGGLFSFLFLTGFDPPIVRAVIMGTLTAWAMSMGRHTDPRNIVLFSLILIGIENPLVVQRDIGFMLSASATLGILFWSSYWEEKFKKFPHIIRTVLAVTLSAQLAVSGILIFFFEKMPIMGVFSNLITEPLIPFAMAGSFLASMTGFIPGIIGDIGAFPARLIIETILSIAGFFGQIEPIELNQTIGKIIFGITILLFLFEMRIKTFDNLIQKNTV